MLLEIPFFHEIMTADDNHLKMSPACQNQKLEILLFLNFKNYWYMKSKTLGRGGLLLLNLFLNSGKSHKQVNQGRLLFSKSETI